MRMNPTDRSMKDYSRHRLSRWNQRRKNPVSLKNRSDCMAFLETMPVGVLLFQNERLIYINPSGIKLMRGETADSMLGTSINDLMVSGHIGRFRLAIQELEQSDQPSTSIELSFLRQDGSTVEVEGTLSLGKIRGRIVVQCAVMDLSDRKQAVEVRKVLECSKNAAEMKRRLVSHLDHDIRGPLNTIIGFSQILERDATLSPKQGEQVQTIARSGATLLRRVHRILELSKMETDEFIVHETEFSLRGLLEELHRTFRFRAEEKNLRLVTEVQPNLTDRIVSDENKIRQILSNLLANACAYTHVGRVIMKAEAIDSMESIQANNAIPENPETEGSMILRFEVKDTGQGIAREDMASLFEASFSPEADKTKESLGFGLAISHMLADLMGGTIEVRSIQGYGSVFRCAIPVQIKKTQEKEEIGKTRYARALESSGNPVSIMVVDDQPDSRAMLRALLESVGFQVSEAEDGQQALERFDRTKPDAILMDIRMPTMDGITAAMRLKEEGQSRQIPIVAITAEDMEENRPFLSKGAFDGYLRKPIHRDELLKALGSLIHARYVFEQESEGFPIRNEREITRKDLLTLPVELTQSMLQTVEKGEMIQFKEFVSTIEASHPEIAHALSALAKKFDYETLSELLSR